MKCIDRDNCRYSLLQYNVRARYLCSPWYIHDLRSELVDTFEASLKIIKKVA